MTTIAEVDPSQTAGEVFQDVFQEARLVTRELASLRSGFGGRSIAGEAALMIGDNWCDLPEPRGAEVDSTHVYAVRSTGERSLLSVTNYRPGMSSLIQPFSVGTYRGDEKFPDHPDFFIKEEKRTGEGLIVCELGAAGLRASGASDDESFGQSAMEPDQVVGQLPAIDRTRLGIVVRGVRAGIAAIDKIRQGEDVEAVLATMHAGAPTST
jgi:hypothetical protein